MPRSPSSESPCPCGGIPAGAAFAACCEPALSGRAWPATAEALMRSRYTAFAVGDGDHLFRTWHPRTRPRDTAPEPGVEFTGLIIDEVVGGGVDDAEGIVAFTAHSRAGGRAETLRERSHFVRRAGRWMYVDGEAG